MNIYIARISDVEEWSELRAALWSHDTFEAHRMAILQSVRKQGEQLIAFIARDNFSAALGFAEAALRNDYVNGCKTSPVVFLEGIYVRPDARRQGIARSLCDAVAKWSESRGCSEFASDATIDNEQSHDFHRSLGFEERERVVYFGKNIRNSPPAAQK